MKFTPALMAEILLVGMAFGFLFLWRWESWPGFIAASVLYALVRAMWRS